MKSHNPSSTQRPTQVGWRVADWAADVSISKAYTWKLIAEKKIDTRSIGKARIITTSPAEFIASLTS